MKKKVLFSIALAGLMLGACSKDAIDNGGNGASWNENGEGYISLAVNLPTGSGSRANGDFADGKVGEYAVKDAILMLFSNADDSEESAKFESAYNLDLGNWNLDNTEQITSTAKIVQKINEITNANIYALVVLNGNGIFTVGSADASLTINTTPVTTTTTLSDLNDIVKGIADDEFWKETGFLMSNSPLFSLPGGSSNPDGGNVSVLSKIDGKKIYPTESEAAADVAATIFVERAQAKVQVKYTEDGETVIENPGSGSNVTSPTVTYKYKITGWGIDNYNTKSLLTRKFNTDWDAYSNTNGDFYRFVDANEVKNSSSLYRTYWGEDVNYGNNTGLITVGGESPALSLKNDEIAYCFENTTSSVPAIGNQLTRIIVSAELSQDGTPADFFLVNNDRFNMYFNGGVTSPIQDKIKEYLLEDENVDAAIKALALGTTFTKEHLTVTLNDLSKSGVLDNTTISVAISKDSFGGTIDWTGVETAITNALKAKDANERPYLVIDYYQGGVCYYDAYIRHFNDDEAAWDGSSVQNEQKHLGRYGVVRNNWYVLNIKSIKNIGDSTVPVVPSEPVDKEELYLSVEINIMPWVMREQDVDL